MLIIEVIKMLFWYYVIWEYENWKIFKLKIQSIKLMYKFYKIIGYPFSYTWLN